MLRRFWLLLPIFVSIPTYGLDLFLVDLHCRTALMVKTASPKGSLEEISDKVEGFRKSFEQEAVVHLSWRDKFRRSLIRKLSNDSAGTALYMLNPKAHADYVVLQSAVQRGQAASEALLAEFTTTQENIRAKIKYLAGEHPQSIASRLKGFPLEYKRALLRLRATSEKLKEVGPSTPQNYDQTFKMMTSEIQNGALVEVEKSFTRDDLERNERIYKNKVKQIETDRDSLLKEQAQVSMELSKMEELIRAGTRATETVEVDDKVVKDSLDLASEIRAGLATRIVIKSGTDASNDVTFHLGKATSEAGHQLRIERTNIALSSTLNRRLKFVRIQKNVEKRVEDMKAAYERVVAINPRMADHLQLKVKLEAAKMANGFAMKATRLGLTAASSGSVIVGVTQALLSAFGADAEEPLSPDEQAIADYDEKLAKEEERCRSLARNKKEFDKCLQSYVDILRTHPKYPGAFIGIEASQPDLPNFVNDRNSFLAQMIAYAEEENKFATDTNVALDKAYEEFNKAQEELNAGVEELLKPMKELPPEETKK